MGNHTRERSYTKIAKCYNLTCLVLITLGSISFVIFTVLGADGTNTSTREVFCSIAIALAGILGIIGIFQEKLWAKWLAIVIYSLCIFAAFEGIVNSFSAETAFKLFINSNTLIALRIGRLILIIVLLVGGIFLLKKPHPEENSEGRK